MRSAFIARTRTEFTDRLSGLPTVSFCVYGIRRNHATQNDVISPFSLFFSFFVVDETAQVRTFLPLIDVIFSLWLAIYCWVAAAVHGLKRGLFIIGCTVQSWVVSKNHPKKLVFFFYKKKLPRVHFLQIKGKVKVPSCCHESWCGSSIVLLPKVCPIIQPLSKSLSSHAWGRADLWQSITRIIYCPNPAAAIPAALAGLRLVERAFVQFTLLIKHCRDDMLLLHAHFIFRCASASSVVCWSSNYGFELIFKVWK